VKDKNETSFLSFQRPYYMGSYKESALIFEDEIVLNQGHDDSFVYDLEGGMKSVKFRNILLQMQRIQSLLELLTL
jgi:hypothetical protein